jgi:hypothetical protein
MTYNAPSSTPLSAPDWETNTAYPENALVEYNDNIYICLTAHTSGTFADDLANGKWKLVSMTLTAATPSELGGVKSNSVDGGVTVDSDGKMTINLPKATSSTLGGVKIGDGLSITADGTLSATGSGTSIDEWTAGNTYAVGDFVTHQNLLYKCTTANSDATWTPANWQKIGDVNFTGATTLANGTNGLVPPPTTSDISKFLCGDGTWKSVGGSGLYVSKEILWTGNENTATPTGTTLSLTNDYTNYDYLLVYFGYNDSQYPNTIKNIGLFDCSSPYNNFEYVFNSRVNSSTVSTVYTDIDFSGSTWRINKYSTTISDVFINKIVGIKFTPNPNNYSTTEQEIGTWIDGKKLYQKTFTGSMPTTGSSYNIDISTLGVDTVYDMSGMIECVGGVLFALNRTNSSSEYIATIITYDSNISNKRINISWGSGVSFLSTSKYYVTIKYTKA